jgi:predicted lipid-binding transport protein (Tim44 family)
MNLGKLRAFALLGSLMMVFTLVSVDFADARRGGSFGSRGSRTFSQAPATRTAPQPTTPVERSMTPNTNPSAATRQQTGLNQPRPGLFGNSLFRGLMIGGLIGMFLGYGFGGMAGMLGFVVQLLLLGLVVMLAMRFFRSRQTPATAGGPDFNRSADRDFGARLGAHAREVHGQSPGAARAGSFTIPGFGGDAAPQSQDIELEQADLDRFEHMLDEVQTAFAKEDYAALRRLSTPEMVSYFSEELAQNATDGLRNDVTGTRLIQADVAEAWREDGEDYATAAFLYESIDVMRDRTSGRVVEGNETNPTETTELWTFVRPVGGEWKLSAIQDASA